MSEITLTTVNPVVFDDPVYCNNKEDNCPRIFWTDTKDEQGSFCSQFSKILDEKRIEYNAGIEIYYYRKALKCQECQDHYNQAIQAKKAEQAQNQILLNGNC